MKTTKNISIIILGAALTVSVLACGPSKENRELMKSAGATFGTIPEKMPGAESDTAALIALGKKLYFEKRLSANDSQSCNSCHRVDESRGGVDNEATSLGAFGKRGGRNAPTVWNAGFHLAQFWDGRAKDLAAQAKGPILNPIEMAMPDAASVVKKLSAITEYAPLFAKAFPADKSPLTYENLAGAIAAFERTLRTNDRLDDFQNGAADALTEQEKRGLKSFMAVGCQSCHNGPLLGGNSYRKLGQVNAYRNSKDLGRYDLTKKDADKFVFKVPALRNIANTAPYFHDGAVKTLEEAVKEMAWLQLGRKLKEPETADIVAFLKSLSDKKQLKPQASK